MSLKRQAGACEPPLKFYLFPKSNGKPATGLKGESGRVRLVLATEWDPQNSLEDALERTLESSRSRSKHGPDHLGAQHLARYLGSKMSESLALERKGMLTGNSNLVC